MEKSIKLIDKRINRRLELHEKKDITKEERKEIFNKEFNKSLNLFGITEKEYIEVSTK